MDAHEREGMAATAAMDRRPLAIGDKVKGYAGGRAFAGTLVAIQGDRCDVELDRAWIVCQRRDIERITDG